MAMYLARACPRCKGHIGIVLREPERNAGLRGMRALFQMQSSSALETTERQTITAGQCTKKVFHQHTFRLVFSLQEFSFAILFPVRRSLCLPGGS